MKEPKVSIIIPVFNSENYLDETIKSVLDQTYQNVEVIVVDDGSTDNSLQIAKKYEENNLKVYSQENRGACAARNLGFEKCTGEYVQFLDADDVMSSDKIQEQMDRLRKEPLTTLATCNWLYFEEGQIIKRENDLKIFKDYENPINLLKDLWIRQDFFSSSSFLTSRLLIEKAGLWDEGILNNQDGEFFCRVILKSEKIIYCDKALVYYRKGVEDSISNQLYLYRNAKSRLETYIKYQDHLKGYLELPDVKRALATNFYYFIYVFYEIYPDLVNIAIEKTKELGISAPFGIGGKNFQKLSKTFGFYNVLKTRKFVNRFTGRFKNGGSETGLDKANI